MFCCLSGELHERSMRALSVGTCPLSVRRAATTKPLGKPPIVFAGAEELIDEDLRDVDGIPELRFQSTSASG